MRLPGRVEMFEVKYFFFGVKTIEDQTNAWGPPGIVWGRCSASSWETPAGAIFTCILSIGFSFFGSWILAVVLLGGVGGGVVGSKEVLGFTAMPSPKAAASQG